jgi:hypothetical protein
MSFRLSITPVEFLEAALNSGTADPVAALKLAKKEEQRVLSEMNKHVKDLTDKHREELQRAMNHITALDIDKNMLEQENERLKLQLAMYAGNK